LQPGKDVTHFFEKFSPLVSQGDLRTRACEEREAEFLFEILQLAAHHRLRTFEQTCGGSHAARGVDRCEGLELAYCHGHGTLMAVRYHSRGNMQMTNI